MLFIQSVYCIVYWNVRIAMAIIRIRLLFIVGKKNERRKRKFVARHQWPTDKISKMMLAANKQKSKLKVFPNRERSLSTITFVFAPLCASFDSLFLKILRNRRTNCANSIPNTPNAPVSMGALSNEHSSNVKSSYESICVIIVS